MSKPFLMLTHRSDEVIFHAEAEEIPRLSNWKPGEWVRHRIDIDGLPEIDLNDWSGIVVCGGPWDAGAPDERKSPAQRRAESQLAELYPRILDAAFPYLGICYGLGTLNSYLGGACDTSAGEDISGVRITVTDEGRKDPLLHDYPESFDAFVGHHEGTSRLAPECTVIASGQNCLVQMVRVGEAAWATQFHPEMDINGVLLRVQEFGGQYFLPEEATRIAQQVQKCDPQYSNRVLSAFADFARR